MKFDKRLLEILACPKCKGGLEFMEKQSCLRCDHCKLDYLIKDGIPIMLEEAAQKING
ncbi:MAG: Trm112 family protein [Deltaproteobacteria bacterium]|nr:Trm112 family protein [Deltaproteobacteria bacterium]